MISSHLERDSHNYIGRYEKIHIQTFEDRLCDGDMGTQSHTLDYIERKPYIQSHIYTQVHN